MGIGGRSATTLGSGTAVGSDDQGFSDSFGPLAARVYIVPPAGW
jgi:ribonuclease HIII